MSPTTARQDEAIVSFNFLCTTTKSHYNRPLSQVGFLRQSIQITGLGTPSFSKAIKAIHEVDRRLSLQEAADSVQPWSPSQFDTFPSIDIGNRYFTHRSDAYLHDIVDFSPDVDPNGILRRSGQNRYVHCTDNEVKYFRRAYNYGMTR